MIRVLIAMATLVVSVNAFSGALVKCPSAYVGEIWVEATRDDEGNEILGDKLFLSLVDSAGEKINCNGNNLFFLSNSKPAYDGVLSMALSSLAMDKQVDIYLNSAINMPLATEISIIRIARD